MGRSQSNAKTTLLATRVTPRIKDLITQMAYREGLHVSEWIRNIIINELKRNGLLHANLRELTFQDEQRFELLRDQTDSIYYELNGSKPGT